VSMRQLMPAWTFGWWRLLDSWMSRWPMFALVQVERVRGASEL